jgi:hypothetical protein
MRKIVGACAGPVNTRENSVCKELELASAIESSVAPIIDVGSCVGLVNTRENSVCKELELASAIEKRADKG